MTDVQYLHTYGALGFTFAYPVDVLSRGAKFARVRLRHKTLIGSTWFPRGTVKSRVPLGCLLDEPVAECLSIGGGRFRSMVSAS